MHDADVHLILAYVEFMIITTTHKLQYEVMLAYMLSSSSLAIELDSIHVSQSLSDGMTLVSQGGKFELGFFSPGNSSHKRYLGIWYKKIPIQTVVWVANRANPINDFSGILTMNSTGNLLLTKNGTETTFWSTISRKQAKNPVLELLESGNLVLRNEEESNPKAYLWQSFDYPSDTFLPTMKLGRDLRNGFNRRITSWKSPNDPSPGDLSIGLVLNDYPVYYMMNGTKKLFRAGPWNGLYFSGEPNLSHTYIFEVSFVTNKDEIYFSFNTKVDSITGRGVISQTSQSLAHYLWDDNLKNWKFSGSWPGDVCDKYDLCGAYAYCSVAESKHVCQCFKGFSPKSPEEWNSNNSSQGCIRDKPLSCNVTTSDVFVKYTGLKVPDTQHTKVDENITLDECRNLCLKNCSCMAYTNSDIRGGGRGCAMWFGNLIDIKMIQSGGQDLYIRMPAFESGFQQRHKKKVIIASTIAAFCATLLLCVYVIYRIRRNNIEKSKIEEYMEGHVNDTDLPLFDLLTITTATHKFSLNNKIGQGGFGPVYKGKLADGLEIAVKRLSHSSTQGMTEFITEVKLIAKLQHRNLVKLLGCCIQGEEILLVYEYVVNGSLDTFIFDQTKGKLLDWPQRLGIIFGITRGLLYLHQDSRLRIIHRDLKASNVLLDDKLNPKISDFGTARTFGGDQTEGNTNRVVGTYGYMAPEYAIDGLYSIKSDVFSFGILMMEIICGTKNRALCHANQTLNLIGYAWRLWKEEKALELIDSSIKESCVISEVLRCIHLSLLCVQQYPEDRPTMASVLLMLASEMDLVDPKEPGFFPKRVSIEANSQPHQCEVSTNDDLTITSLDGRDGMTLVSQGGKFELGFFSPGNSSHKRYLGIWYKKIPIQTVVWVANRVNPINGSLGTLTINSTGNLLLTENGTETTVWSTSTISQKQAKNPVLKLLDSGNLVLRNEGESNPKAYLWQSFDYPTDTFLPTMKLGRDLRKGLDWRITCWKSPNDPSPGDFSLGLVVRDYPVYYMMNGTQKVYRSGPWNGLYFSGFPDLSFTYVFEDSFVTNKDEISYSYNTKVDSIIGRGVISQTSQSLTSYLWDDNLQNWKVSASTPGDVCDKYDLCGAYAYCSVAESQHLCQCFKGFSPKSPEEWNSNNSSQGCIRDDPLSCNVTSTDVFVKYTGLKVPDTQHTKLHENINLDECRNLCLKNCSCMAYANSDIRGGGSGCAMWFGDLIDIKLFQNGGQDLYIRMPAFESGLQHRHKQKVIIASTIVAFCATLLLCVYVIYRVRRNNIEKSNIEEYVNDTDLPLFDLLTITTATHKFSLNNKIGQGGFGPVYKGKLADGLEIAVKRLSHSSTQGMTEFITEVKLIAKLQHRNLVKLLGCCIQGEEILLVYEYVAWRLWKEDKALELIDSSIKESCVISEVMRCIHVSLLCVQQYPEDRPTMASVLLMLASEMDLDEPKEPGFFPKWVSMEANSQPHQCELSYDELTVTSLDGR
ncbi:hypothetical protein Ahy_B08g089357 [Arachis hypogaea]|uniref:non-specific serine/threonine protein kinase n=2 Tax=Arachis TaxID=3817 RepID=A0A444XXE0_ARAHY|nr:hypothetical protein Ahy_B08g089357 [Arachis hypogaea]